MLRIEEFGSPVHDPSTAGNGGSTWDDDWDDVGPEADMDGVEERWEALDGWAARDGSHPPFGEIPVNALELLPQGALDNAEPDRRRLKGSTGNTGPTLEFIYRLAALVVWPREMTVEIVAGGSIDRAVEWVETQWAEVRCGGDGDDGRARARDGVRARAGDGGSGRAGDPESERIRELLGTLTGLWPIGMDAPRKQDRAAMLRLLHATGEGEVAADFLDRVVMANYDGSENEALAAVLPVIGPAEAGEILPWLVEEQLPRRFADVVELLVLAAVECMGSGSGAATPVIDPVWYGVLRASVATALSGMGPALQAESEIRPGEDDKWPLGTWLRSRARSGRAPQDEWIDNAALCGLLLLANRLGLDEEAAAAAHAIGDHPDIVTPDRMLPAALELMHKQGALAATAAYGALWRQAADYLLERSSAVPGEPTDWTIAADASCECDLCDRLRAFCEDPVKQLERFKMRTDLRRHLHQVIDRGGLDLYHETERRGSPYTLVCTKNRASHERRLEEYAEDLRCMGKLLASTPEGKGRGTGNARVERLEVATAPKAG